MLKKAVLGFGSNFGARISSLKKAIRELSLNKDLNMLAISHVYETEPWGYADQNNFLNCTAVFLCRIPLAELAELIQKTEKKIGRINRGKWQAREIDIDILFYSDLIYKSSKFEIPHPLIEKRNFVLRGLVELMPGYIHPTKGKSIEYLSINSKDKCKVKLYKHNI